jgi:hypothetical protein
MYDDLIGLAKTIADLDPKKPRQANLRRAVSGVSDAEKELYDDCITAQANRS